MRSRWILQLVVLTGLTALPIAGLKAGEDEKKEPQGKTPYRVYFIGHSLYGCGNVPAAVQFLSEAANVDRPIKATVYLRGGGDAPELLGNSGSHEAFAAGTMGHRDHRRKSATTWRTPTKSIWNMRKKLDNEAKKRNIRVLEYVAWPWVKVSGDQVFEKRMKAQDAFNQPFIRLAKETGATLVPCGPGLVNVIKKDQKFMADFHYGDVHVSLLGSYFTACVIFAEIYDKSPEGLPSVFHEYKIDKETARILQVTAWETVKEWQKIQNPWKTGDKLPVSASP